MVTQTLLEQRTERILNAIKLEKNDRTPMLISGSVAFLKYVDPTSTIGDYVRDPIGSTRKFVSGLGKLNNLDMIHGVNIWPGVMGTIWFCKVKLPGRELGDDDYWQLDEKAFMTRDDYDIILNKGWNWYYDDVIFNRLGYTEEDFAFAGKFAAECNAVLTESGYPVFSGIMSQSVIDKLTSGRGTVDFFRDMRQIPDKLQAVIDVMLEAELAKLDESLKTFAESSLCMVTPAIRCTCDYISQEFFEKFVWRTMYKPADKILDAGHYVFFHNDSNWNDFLHLYTRFPAKRCIYDSDGQTDIYKIKDILGSKMCITGNVSSSLLSLGTPDEVYNFCRRQIEDMGDGYILSGSCTIPPNSKPENLEAMNAAAAG